MWCGAHVSFLIILTAQQPEYSFIISARPSVDIPIGEASELYGIGGGCAVSATTPTGIPVNPTTSV